MLLLNICNIIKRYKDYFPNPNASTASPYSHPNNQLPTAPSTAFPQYAQLYEYKQPSLSCAIGGSFAFLLYLSTTSQTQSTNYMPSF